MFGLVNRFLLTISRALFLEITEHYYRALFLEQRCKLYKLCV